MDDDLLIARIRGLCTRLVEIAPWWAGCWAPIKAARLSKFEALHGVVLPGGYRRLLAEIGDRAPVPGRPRGGLIPLDRALDLVVARDWLGSLAAPFPGAGDDPIELEWDDVADAYADPTPLRGCLPILDAGETAYLLVVSGDGRGRVWSFTASGSPELRPSGAEFLPWYLGELTRGMAPLEAEAEELAALERRVRQAPADRSAMPTLGRRLLLTDRDRARVILEQAWAERASLDDESFAELRRGVAELDLLSDRGARFDRIEGMAELEDDWLRTYAGVAASRAGDPALAIERLESAKIPALLRAAAIGHLAAAHAALGRVEQGLALLRGVQASASNHALAAQLRTRLGQREAALRSWREALAASDRSRTGPRRPRLSDFIELPTPDADAIEAAMRELEAG